MLEYIFQHPDIYKNNPNNVQQNHNAIVMFLKQMSKSGVMVCFERSGGIRQILNYIEQWPPEYSIQAKKLLSALGKSQRIVEIPCNNSVHIEKPNACYTKICFAFYRVACSAYPVDAMMVSNDCYEVLKHSWEKDVELVNIEKIALCDIDERLKKISLSVMPGTVTKTQFQQKILDPLFRSAGSVKIIDKMIGISSQNNDGRVPRNFMRGIGYLIETIANSPNGNQIYVELITAVDAQTVDGSNIVKNIKKCVSTASKMQHGIEVYVDIKKLRTSEERMPHDRYIITDQFALQFGHGMDLLDQRDYITDTTVSLLDSTEASKVELYVNALTSI